MRRLRTFEHISLDGVVQRSDDGDGFAYSDWLANEVVLIVYPVLLGTGKRLGGNASVTSTKC